MPTLNCFVVRARYSILDLLLLLLLLLGVVLLLLLLLLGVVLVISILGLVVVVLVHSVNVVLLLLLMASTVASSHVLPGLASSAKSSKVSLILHATPAISTKVLLLRTTCSLLSGLPPAILLVLARGLVAILELDVLLGENELLRSELVAWFAELLVAMSEVAQVLQYAVFVSFIVPTALSFVLLVKLLLSLLLSRRLVAALVENHLAGHHVLLGVLLLLLLVAGHHSHELRSEHLVLHLAVAVLHLLHAHARYHI